MINYPLVIKSEDSQAYKDLFESTHLESKTELQHIKENEDHLKDDSAKDLNLPVEGEPELAILANPKVGPPTPSTVSYADSKTPTKQSNKRKKGEQTYDALILRKPTRSSRLHSKTAQETVKELIQAAITLISMILAMSPHPNQGKPHTEVEDNDEIDHSIRHEEEDKEDLKMQHYHHILEKMDESGQYQRHYTKMDKILRHTRGGKQTLLQKWKTGEESWIPLCSLKNHDLYSNVIYAPKTKLIGQKEWTWIKDFVDNKTTYETTYETTKSFGQKQKFGIQVPRSVKHALELDARNGNTLWRNAIMIEIKQMDGFKVFRNVEPGNNLEGLHNIPYHMVFDVKLDLRRKARLMMGGNHSIGSLVQTIYQIHLLAAGKGNAFLHETRDKLRSIALVYKMIHRTRLSYARFHEKLLKRSLKPSKIETDLAMEFRDTLRMLGVHLDGSALMLRANKDVVTTLITSVLKEKHCARTYHQTWEAVAARAIQICHVDVLTQGLPNPVFHTPILVT